MGLLHVDALMLLGLPLLDQQHHVLLLSGEVVVIADAAFLRPDGGQDALGHDVPDVVFPAAGLGGVFNV